MPDAGPLREQEQERLFIIAGLTLSPLTEDEAANKECCEGECECRGGSFFPYPLHTQSFKDCDFTREFLGNAEMEGERERESRFGAVQRDGS